MLTANALTEMDRPKNFSKLKLRMQEKDSM